MRKLLIVLVVLVLGFVVVIYLGSPKELNNLTSDEVPSNIDSGNLSSDVNKPYTFLYSSELVNKKEDKVPGNIDYAEFVTTTEAYSNSLYQMPGIYLYFYPSQKDLDSWFNDSRAINVGELSQEKLFIADNPQYTGNSIVFNNKTPMIDSISVLVKLNSGILMLHNLNYGSDAIFNPILLSVLESLKENGNLVLSEGEIKQINEFLK